MIFPIPVKYYFLSIVLLLTLSTCKKDTPEPIPAVTLPYFPPVGNTNWETIAPSGLGWNTAALTDLYSYLEEKNTRSFLILVNGKIAVEKYFNGHTQDSVWKWNSAGKTLTTATIGIAQGEGLIDIHHPVSDYLGTGWTPMAADKEGLITPYHLLSMTSGINDASELVIRPNLTYLADAGTRWSYHNVFQKLMDVVAETSNETFEDYFTAKLKNRIGMDGYWREGLVFTIYNSTTRSMGRFGLLALHQGTWNGTTIVPKSFFQESIQSSQTINPAYGYLWWLNGKTSYMLPDGQTVYTGTLIPNAPSTLYAAMGAQDQRIYVVPEEDIVIVRMGDAANPTSSDFAVSGFDNELWGKLNAVGIGN
ncbi:MAG: beta-lactamase family protein [Cytophagaceae bacterium]|jgi:CubicO group peptidase (beta-lactamase class C family)|nr:beta-lactamase family protein [Cytophagaceae bacterium]